MNCQDKIFDAREAMTDLELMDKFCAECRDFIDPRLFREIDKRGLYHFVNHLPNNKAEAKAVLRARLSKSKRFFNEPEIDKIAGEISRLEDLRKSLVSLDITDVDEALPILNEMKERAEYVKDYFNPSRIPE